MSDQQIIAKVTQHYKRAKPTKEVRRELASSLRAANRLLQELAQAEKHINFQTKFSIAQLVKYSMRVEPLPLEVDIPHESRLMMESQSYSRKTADPKYEVINRDSLDSPRNSEVFRSNSQIILNIEVEEGAALLYTQDGQFPIANQQGTMIINRAERQRTVQLTIERKCILRMVAKRFDKLPSNCVSLELSPQFSSENRRESYIIKHLLRMDESATVQSDPNFK